MHRVGLRRGVLRCICQFPARLGMQREQRLAPLHELPGLHMQVDAGIFSALLTLVQTGARQSLTIKPNGTDIAEVMIAFTRSGT